MLLLSARIGLPRGARLFAAALCVLVPWAVVSTSYLAEPVAYPAFAWVLYATWMTMRLPSLRHDALALLALAAAVLSRTALLALLPLLPLAVLWQELACELSQRPLGERLRMLPQRVWRRHRLITALTLAGIVVLAAGALGLLPGRGLASLAGDYGLPRLESLGGLLTRYRDYLARMAVGTGGRSAALAIPWCARELVRHSDPDSHAAAVVCTLGVAAVLLSLVAAPTDERYVMYAAIPISIAAGASLGEHARSAPSRLRASPGIVAGSLVVIYLIASTTWQEVASPYDYFSYPADVFYQHVLLGRASTYNLPLVHVSAGARVDIAVLAVAVVWMLVMGRLRSAAGAAAALLGAFAGLTHVVDLQSVVAAIGEAFTKKIAAGNIAAATAAYDAVAGAAAAA